MRGTRGKMRLLLVSLATAIVMLGTGGQLAAFAQGQDNTVVPSPMSIVVASETTPTLRVDDYGALVGTAHEHGGYTYQNMQNAYVKYRLVSGVYEYTYKANFNFAVDGTSLTFAPVAESIYLEGLDDIAFNTDKNSNDYVGDEIAGMSNEDKNAIRQSFKAAVKRAVEGGWSVGLRISEIKRWEGVVLIEYKFGDGNMYHDGSPNSSRSKMSLVVLDTESNVAHCVGQHALTFGTSAVKTLGYPVSDFFSETKVFSGNEELTLTGVQFFNAGYIHMVNGMVRVVKEKQYLPGDGGIATLLPVPGPTVPESFRGEISRHSSNGNYYINYERGCVLAEVNDAGTGYFYTSYYGRNYDANDGNKIKKIALNKLFSVTDIRFGNEFSGVRPERYATNGEFFQLFYDAYAYWYERDIILGMVDDGIKGWKGNTFILQFMYGDSSADPFGDSRTNIAALSYNTTKHEVYLIIDGGMNVFDTSDLIGMPLENPQYNTSVGVWIQRFSSTSGVGANVGNNYIIWNGSIGTLIRHQSMSYTKYIESNSGGGGASHEGNPDKGYIAVGKTISSDVLKLPQSVVEALSTKKGRDAALVFTLLGIFVGLRLFTKGSGFNLLGRF